jgi:hypothetical protein
LSIRCGSIISQTVHRPSAPGALWIRELVSRLSPADWLQRGSTRNTCVGAWLASAFRVTQDSSGASARKYMNFYLMAAAIGLALIVIWIAWLLAVRAFLRSANTTPGALLSVLQVVVVLALMLGAYRVSEWYFRVQAVNPADAPALLIKFRRIWIIIWALGMAASIQLFIDIRRMSTPVPSATRRPSQSAARRRPRR